MAYEIDFLPVGEGEKSGDAIALRFGDLGDPSSQKIIVIDGGSKDSGAALVQHIKTYYRSEVVHAVICTHSDSDHASGLTEVIENLKVGCLVMHQPWNHVADLDQLLKDAECSGSSLKRHFKKSLDAAHALQSLAEDRDIPIYEPFAGTAILDGTLVVLGPTESFYEELLASFRCADDLLAEKGLLERVFAKVGDAVRWVKESWHVETLVEPSDDACSAENNSSAIILLSNGDDSFLFTSDAGVEALTRAADYCKARNFDLKSITRLQVPHHGSKHNVGPKVLDRIIGPRISEETYSKSSIVSVSKGGEPKHPSRRVVNALMRRGVKMFATQGRTIRFASKDAPARDGWGPAPTLPFYNMVEE
jgi:beta-lactamase superfamily II metal-dependent hydrolase